MKTANATDIDWKEPNFSPDTESGVTISGRVAKPVKFTMTDLLQMETESFKDILIACGTGEKRGVISQCKGVLLEKLILKSNVDKGEHNDTKRMFIVATAADGYRVLFSWQEIFNTATGGGVMLVMEKDGQPLDDSRQKIDLISALDYFAGARYVRDIRTIEIILYPETI